MAKRKHQTMTGHELRALRKAAGLSQEALAAKLKVSWSTVQRWEALGDNILRTVNAAAARAAVEKEKRNVELNRER